MRDSYLIVTLILASMSNLSNSAQVTVLATAEVVTSAKVTQLEVETRSHQTLVLSESSGNRHERIVSGDGKLSLPRYDTNLTIIYP